MLKVLKTALFATLLSLNFALIAEAGPTCTTGKPCGDTCISKDKECHVPAAKVCKTGKPCGDSCIAQSKTCTK